MNRARFLTGELATFHANPRVGDLDAIAASLRVNGQYKPIVVNLGTKTGRPLEVLAGNHTLLAARQLGWRHIEAVTVDVDDVAAMRIVAADNRLGDLGGYDDQLLADLLGELPDLDGSGFDEDSYQQLLDDLDLQHLPAELALERDRGEGDSIPRAPTLSVGSHRIPLTMQEWADWQTTVNAWLDVRPDTQGLVAFLLEGAGR